MSATDQIVIQDADSHPLAQVNESGVAVFDWPAIAALCEGPADGSHAMALVRMLAAAWREGWIEGRHGAAQDREAAWAEISKGEPT